MPSEPNAVPAGVLWDLDGTLVDTEPAWIAAEHQIVAAHGGTWSHEDARAIVGFDLLDAAAYIRANGGVQLEPQVIVEQMLDAVMQSIANAVPWRPGALALLAELAAARVPCALVTMSWRRLADAVVSALPTGSFAVTITGDEVANGKPHPEPYLAAAAALGVPATACIAIEDSPTGAASAESAGCTVVVVPNVVDVPESPGRWRFTSLTEVDLATIRRIAAATSPAEVL